MGNILPTSAFWRDLLGHSLLEIPCVGSCKFRGWAGLLVQCVVAAVVMAGTAI